MWHFEHKIFLTLLLLLPLLVMWDLFIKKRGKRYIFYSSKKLLEIPQKKIKPFLIRNMAYIKLISLILFIIAMARPQILYYYDIESNKGIDILLTLDISGSMASLDFKPRNRLEVAKEVIENFIKKRETDRIGFVAFAGSAFTKCPLTLDYDILRYFLNNVSIGELEDGTAMGMALATSVNRIKHSKSKTKIIILLTDGVNNRGEIDPGDAAVIARDFGIKVYTIGVGKRGKAPFPVTDSFGRKQQIMVDVEIDEKVLREIANSTGGLYFRATDKKSLDRIFSEINKWEKSEISVKRFYNRKELYHYFLLSGLLLLLIIEFSKRSFLRTLP
ncbi:MAG: VWA domain-containing protein [Acidobacteriota bacterium]